MTTEFVLMPANGSGGLRHERQQTFSASAVDHVLTALRRSSRRPPGFPPVVLTYRHEANQRSRQSLAICPEGAVKETVNARSAEPSLAVTSVSVMPNCTLPFASKTVPAMGAGSPDPCPDCTPKPPVIPVAVSEYQASS